MLIEVRRFYPNLINRTELTNYSLCNRAADLTHIQTISRNLQTGHRSLQIELENSDALNEEDAFPRQMIRFSKEAKERLALLTDVVDQASGAYTTALRFYGEDAKSITSTTEFFKVFQTFVTSYQVRSSFGSLIFCCCH
jgi:hypothetical protein